MDRKNQIDLNNKHTETQDQGKYFEIKMASVTLQNIKDSTEEPDIKIDPIEKRYSDYQVKLQDVTGNDKAFEIQQFMYNKLINRKIN